MKPADQLMEEADVEDWTCPNCGHQSPTRTFDILEQMQDKLDRVEDHHHNAMNIQMDLYNIQKEQLKEVLALLEDCYEDMKRLRVSGDDGYYDECKVERNAREALEKLTKKDYN